LFIQRFSYSLTVAMMPGCFLEALILDFRKKRKLGARRIQNELKRLHDISLSLAATHEVLRRNKVKPLL
jgi:hypothetical protein